jgi:hypothetical protein
MTPLAAYGQLMLLLVLLLLPSRKIGMLVPLPLALPGLTPAAAAAAAAAPSGTTDSRPPATAAAAAAAAAGESATAGLTAAATLPLLPLLPATYGPAGLSESPSGVIS